jgi:hypothetical protein
MDPLRPLECGAGFILPIATDHDLDRGIHPSRWGN